MKKSALILLTLFVFSTTSAYAQALDCNSPSVIAGIVLNAEEAACNALLKDETSCKLLKCLISNSQQTQNDGPWYNQNFMQFSKKVLQGDQTAIFGERYTYAQINWILNSIALIANPVNVTSFGDLVNLIRSIQGALQKAEVPSIDNYAKLGPSGLWIGGMMTLYSTPPASGVDEVKQLASKILDLGAGVSPALAQGYGYVGLGGQTNSATRALWTASRNMAYLIVVIILIAAGFLIMFRVKINPQTVVSLQTMIPKLIITLILITFSFAIAGFVIDLIYVFIAAFVGMLSLTGSTSIVSNSSALISTLTASGFESYFFIQLLGPIIFWLVIATFLGIIGGIATVNPLTGAAVGVIVLVIVGAVYIVTMIKIFWMLVKAYISLVLQICIGPLQIMLDLIPGQNGFGPWIRNLIANASVFAVVPIMLVIQNILTWDFIGGSLLHINSSYGSLGGSSLTLPFLRSPSWMISVFGGFVLFTMTPKVADIIRDMLKIPAFKYGGAIGEAIGTSAKPVGGYFSNVGEKMFKEAAAPNRREKEILASIISATGQTISGASNVGK